MHTDSDDETLKRGKAELPANLDPIVRNENEETKTWVKTFGYVKNSYCDKQNAPDSPIYGLRPSVENIHTANITKEIRYRNPKRDSPASAFLKRGNNVA